MKSWAIWVHCLRLVLADFGRDPRSSESCTARRIFSSVNNDITDFRRPNFTKFEHNTSIGVVMNLFGRECWKFSHMGSFFPQKCKNDFFQRNSAIIRDRRKFITNWSLHGMSSFHLCHWNHFKVIPLACTRRTRNLPKIFCAVGYNFTACATLRWRSVGVAWWRH